MPHRKRNLIFQFFHGLWSLFLTGLFALLPMTLTIAVFTITFRVVQGWLEPLKQFRIPFLSTMPYSEVILAIGIILIAGMLYNIFILRPIIHAIENLFARLPLVRPVYSGIKKLVDAFSLQDKVSFTKVVIVQFPRPEIYSVGFLAGELAQELSPNKSIKYLNIFIPTTPNPTSGFLVLVPEEQVSVIDLTRQEAMAMIISGGIIQPESFKK